ncbi:hypothetical protein AK812_SmicGene13641 [Symbiodinium microadriaticum]|uniref:Uncharacterized protein n=1 Tax=Symbiodinium microadriaticum TaxID=2951 RepID=A0A1Q9E7M0_SYMMI|nr:hypothetical protein AK812_SmicGene13641 [Symbiodinium microadriaticum]
MILISAHADGHANGDDDDDDDDDDGDDDDDDDDDDDGEDEDDAVDRGDSDDCVADMALEKQQAQEEQLAEDGMRRRRSQVFTPRHVAKMAGAMAGEARVLAKCAVSVARLSQGLEEPLTEELLAEQGHVEPKLRRQESRKSSDVHSPSQEAFNHLSVLRAGRESGTAGALRAKRVAVVVGTPEDGREPYRISESARKGDTASASLASETVDAPGCQQCWQDKYARDVPPTNLLSQLLQLLAHLDSGQQAVEPAPLQVFLPEDGSRITEDLANLPAHAEPMRGTQPTFSVKAIAETAASGMVMDIHMRRNYDFLRIHKATAFASGSAYCATKLAMSSALSTKKARHTRHSRIPLRAQQVFTPPDS